MAKSRINQYFIQVELAQDIEDPVITWKRTLSRFEIPYADCAVCTGKQACEKTSFIFLRKELPVRLANIMKEIQLLPDNLLRMPSVSLVQSWYERSFAEILEYEQADPSNYKVLEKFTSDLVTIRNRHNNVVQTMAQGMLELRENHQPDLQAERNIQYFLDRFYISRISIRMLINQHTLLFEQDTQMPPSHIGCIDPHCVIHDVITDAYENAKFLCDQYYLTSPDLVIEEYNPDNPGVKNTVVYVPSHLYHMVFELFKNSMRAVVEHYGTAADVYPSIHALVVRGKEDITIKVHDKGGGIPRSMQELLFQYMFSTAPQPPMTAISDSAPLAGYGYGLPLSRLYARYFQGDLILNSYEGYGTDAIIYLKALSNEANEVLPVFNKTSSRHYRDPGYTHDWSHTSSHHSNGKSGSNNSVHKMSST
ncbi:PDK2 [Cordylochernes scorpioides]|uniref:Protein-serine/threonine kinase n=1 Tax=Cordylochernes scorpioides TaxID=51811 RepID=A0ABY6JX80_9ARAC|nr:PDK2 [Cordylochernes scorpioides]